MRTDMLGKLKQVLMRPIFPRLLKDRKGVAALEFALLLPLMLILLIGGMETGQAVSIYRKMSQTGGVIGDLVSQSTMLNSTAMNDIFTAGTVVMSPYSNTTLTSVVSLVEWNAAKGGYIVKWSKTKGGVAWTTGSAPPITIPSDILSKTQATIVSQVGYTYKSAFSALMTDIWGTDTIAMGDVAYIRPRNSSTISFN